MAARQLPNGKQQFEDINGAPLVGGKVYHYIPSTLTPKDTWQNAGQTILNDNPITLDLRGQAVIWGSGSYRQIVLDADGNQIWDQVTIAPGVGLQDVTITEFYDKARESGFQIETFDSRTLAQAAMIQPNVQLVMTGGYYLAGDGGSALSRRVVSEPVHEGKFQSADGAWWELSPLNAQVNEKQFGGIGDGVADDYDAVQNAVDYAIYNNGSVNTPHPVEVLFIGPKLRITDTLQLGYGTTFTTVRVRGWLKPFRLGANVPGITIVADFLDRPGVNFQGSRHCILQDVLVHGGLYDAFDNIPTTGISPCLEATWNNAEILAGAFSSRYAPYAGITVDAYSGVRPATHYPDVVYPPFLGAVAQYGKNPSSRIQLINVGVAGFNTALAIQPSDVDANGDHISWEQPFVENCKYMVSIGNSQSRKFLIYGGEMRKIYTGFVNNKNGKQIGYYGGEIIGLAGYNFIGQLFEFNSMFNAGPVIFSSLDLESINRIGDILTTNSTGAFNVTFTNVQFNYRHSDSNGVPPNVFGGSGSGELMFEGGSFDGGNSVYSLRSPTVRFDHTSIRVDDARSKVYTQIFHNATQGGVITDPQSVESYSCGFVPINVTTGVSAAFSYVDSNYRFTNRDYCIPLKAPGVRRFGSFRSSADLVLPGTVYNADSALTFSSASITDRTVAFTNPAITNDSVANQMGYMPGDIIRHSQTGTVMAIRSRVGSAVIAELQNNYILNGSGGYDLYDPTFGFTGTWEFIMARNFTPPFALNGNITTGSANITALQTTSATSYNGGLVADDWLWEDVISYVTFSGAADPKISSIDTITPQIVMGGAADNTLTFFPLDHWIRQAPPNEASR